MLLQAITIDDRAYEVEKAARSFVERRSIFPGGCLPSLAVIRRAPAPATDMRMLDLEDITAELPAHAAALARDFVAAAGELARLGYDRRFRRLWELYFAGARAGSRERRIGDVQALLAKPAYRASRENMRREIASSSDAPDRARRASRAQACRPGRARDRRARSARTTFAAHSSGLVSLQESASMWRP